MIYLFCFIAVIIYVCVTARATIPSKDWDKTQTLNSKIKLRKQKMNREEEAGIFLFMEEEVKGDE